MVGVVETMPVLVITKVGKYCRTTVPGEVGKLPRISRKDEIGWVFEDSKVIVRRKCEKHD